MIFRYAVILRYDCRYVEGVTPKPGHLVMFPSFVEMYHAANRGPAPLSALFFEILAVDDAQA
jgi:hypothetical protein